MKTSRKPTKSPAKRAKSAKKTAKPRRPAAKRAAPARPAPARRADFGAPVDGFFAKQAPAMRAILDALRELVAEAAPDATGVLKWGKPAYVIGGEMMCVLGGHKAHVNLVLPGPPGTYADPDGLLEGEGKTGRHLQLRSVDDLPRDAVRTWLRTAAQRARTGGRPG